MIDYPLPVLGFSAYSGTGKTTLLTTLLPLLKDRGLAVGLVKHAHHSFDVDRPGKDSYQLRSAGADQVVVASRRRMVSITEFAPGHGEPPLSDALQALDPHRLDLVLVEGYKHAAFPKIELHRSGLQKPLLFPCDSNIIAIAADRPIATILPQLDLNQPGEIAAFILEFVAAHPGDLRSCQTSR